MTPKTKLSLFNLYGKHNIGSGFAYNLQDDINCLIEDLDNTVVKLRADLGAMTDQRDRWQKEAGRAWSRKPDRTVTVGQVAVMLSAISNRLSAGAKLDEVIEDEFDKLVGGQDDAGINCQPLSRSRQSFTGREPRHQMTLMQEVATRFISSCDPYHGQTENARYSWDYAEAWLAEGKRRGWV